jgi:tetratricopeptide (TPR) repeat protein
VFFVALTAKAQDPADDDLANPDDIFQEQFFEALKQKAIENYQKSNDALYECIAIDSTQSVLYFEIGKNYLKLQNYIQAETNLKKALNFEPNNQWYLEALYDLYYTQNDYEKATPIVKNLVRFNANYKEDLANLYTKTHQYDLALKTLDEIDREVGTSLTRDRLRNLIYSITGYEQARIDNLEQRIDKEPDEEANYLKLIYRYSEQGDTENAYKTALELLAKKPKSQVVHLALYKFYLDEGKYQDAVNSMKIVLNAVKIDAIGKAKVLTDFLSSLNTHPELEAELTELNKLISGADSVEFNLQVAQYFQTKGDKAKAAHHYEQVLKNNPDNFFAIRNVLLLYIDLQDYQKAAHISSENIELYPAQPILYLINGVALNNLNQYQNAIQVLSEGVDYVIDDNPMLRDFYKQLAIAFTHINQVNKAEEYNKMAQELLVD